MTRLRELGRYVNTEGGRWFEPITTEAADEIQRLRTELADWQRTLRAIEPDYFLLRGLVKQFVYQWEQSELGALNGKEYFSAVHALREAVRGE